MKQTTKCAVLAILIAGTQSAIATENITATCESKIMYTCILKSFQNNAPPKTPCGAGSWPDRSNRYTGCSETSPINGGHGPDLDVYVGCYYAAKAVAHRDCPAYSPATADGISALKSSVDNSNFKLVESINSTGTAKTELQMFMQNERQKIENEFRAVMHATTARMHCQATLSGWAATQLPKRDSELNEESLDPTTWVPKLFTPGLRQGWSEQPVPPNDVAKSAVRVERTSGLADQKSLTVTLGEGANAPKYPARMVTSKIMAMTLPDHTEIRGDILYDGDLVVWSHGYYWARSDGDTLATLGTWNISNLVNRPKESPQGARRFVTPASPDDFFCAVPVAQANNDKVVLFVYGRKPLGEMDEEKVVSVEDLKLPTGASVLAGKLTGARGGAIAFPAARGSLLLWDDGRYSWSP